MPVECPLAPARARLLHHFGYSDFRPLQTRVVEALQRGNDVLAVLPTGAGKSICFQVPALLRAAPSIVVSPLISLMQDQVTAAVARGIPAAALNSTLSPKAQRELLEHVVQGSVRLLYTSPERLGRLATDLAERGLRPGLLAVDEAHCISEWGTDFRPAYRTLRKLRARLGWPQVIALTGSATPAVRRDVSRALGLGQGCELSLVLGSFDRRNLWFGVARVRDEAERLRALIATLRLQDALAIVYAPTRNLVEELARVLGNAGFAPRHITLDSRHRLGGKCSPGFSRTSWASSLPPARSAWASTSPMSGSWCTGPCRPRRRRITRRRGERGAMAGWLAAFCCIGRRR
jgi:ATP-dependent DNA helicase RecQ